MKEADLSLSKIMNFMCFKANRVLGWLGILFILLTLLCFLLFYKSIVHLAAKYCVCRESMHNAIDDGPEQVQQRTTKMLCNIILAL